MDTTFSVVESIPHSPVVVVAQFCSVFPQSSSFRLVRQSSRLVKSRSREAPQFTFTHVQSSSREATYVHAQFTAHEEHPSSRPTHLTLRPYRSTDFVQYLSQTTAEILAPPFAQHTPRESFIRFSDHQVFLQSYCPPRSLLTSHHNIISIHRGVLICDTPNLPLVLNLSGILLIPWFRRRL